MVTNTNELTVDIKTKSNLGCSDHALVELAVLRDVGKAKSKVKTLNFRKASFQLFKKLVSRTPWATAQRQGSRTEDAYHNCKS